MAPAISPAFAVMAAYPCLTTGTSIARSAPGKGGYDVIVMEDNLRENLALQYSGGIMPMLFFAKVSAAPSKMMDIAEWRYSDANSDIPISLIIALTTDTPGDQEPNGDPWYPRPSPQADSTITLFGS